jgi:hypothetical protein
VDLSGADLWGADLTQAQLNETYGDETPNFLSTTSPAHWGVQTDEQTEGN